MSFLDAVLLDQKIIRIRDNRQPSDHIFYLGPRMLVHEEQQMKLCLSHVRALPQQGYKNCRLLSTCASPWNPSLTSTLIKITNRNITVGKRIDKDEHWSHSISRSSNSSEYWETERPNHTSHNLVINSKPYNHPLWTNYISQFSTKK